MRCTSHSGAEAPEVSPTVRRALEPRGVDIALVVDEEGRRAELLRELGEAVRVRGVLRADHEHDVGLRRDHLDGVLTVLGRVADVVARRSLDRRESLLEDAHDLVRLVDGQGGLGQVTEIVGVGDLDGARLVRRLHQDGAVGSLSARALDLLVTFVADQHDGATMSREPACFDVHLRDQRARRVDHLEVALAGVVVHPWRHAVGGQHHDCALGHFRLLVDEDRALGLQVPHDVQVVHDLLPHVDGCTVLGESALDSIDGALDPGTVAPGSSEQHGADDLAHDHHGRRQQV